MTTTVFACLPVLPPREIIPPCGGWRQKAIHYAAVRTSAVQIPSADTSSANRIGNTFNTEYQLNGREGTRWGWQRTHYYTLHTNPPPTHNNTRETLLRKNHNSLIGHYSLSPLIRPFRVFLSAEYKELYSRGLHISFKWGCTAHLPSIIMVAYNKDVASDA